MGFDVRRGMIGKIQAIVVQITVKARFPQSGPRKTDAIPIAVLIRHIHHHNDAVGWALFVPSMESDKLGVIVNMIDMDVLTAQPPAHTRQIAPEGDQISIHAQNTAFVPRPTLKVPTKIYPVLFTLWWRRPFDRLAFQVIINALFHLSRKLRHRSC